MKSLILLILLTMLQQLSFKEKQLQYSRVANSYREKEITVKNYFHNKNLKYQGYHLFIRAFKTERKVEVWIRESNTTTYTLLTEYDFCSTSGTLGPKREEGDLQIPEGVYHINHFNPQSNFYLSLGINYPNKSDLVLSDRRSPGSAIYIHGNCVTVGCIPITDDKIKELYILAVEARNNGQEKIPVHIFPAKLTDEKLNSLEQQYNDNQQLTRFWRSLQPVFKEFETKKTIPAVKVSQAGEYYL